MKTVKITFTIILALVLCCTISFNAQAACQYLKNIAGEEYEMGNMLTWSTATETDNKEFLIQKSTDNTNFTTIGTVKSKGNSAKPQGYHFLDVGAQKGKTYYRLTQVNLDGSTKASEAIEVDKGTKNDFTIMAMTPPSVDNQVEITLTASNSVDIDYMVEKLDGKPVYTGKQTLNVGMNLITVDVSGLELGSYRIALKGADESEVLTFKTLEKKDIKTFADFDDGK